MVYIDMCILEDRIKFNIFREYMDRKTVLRKNEIMFPKSYLIGQKLNYIRNLTDIFIQEYGINYFDICIGNGFKRDNLKVFTENITNSVKIEGVLEELFIRRGLKYGNKF